MAIKANYETRLSYHFGECDAAVKGIKISAGSSEIICKDIDDVVVSDMPPAGIEIACKGTKDPSCLSSVCCGSSDQLKKEKIIEVEIGPTLSDTPPMNESPQIISKPRTALFQGRVDDETMASRIMCKRIDSIFIIAGLSSKQCFRGIHTFKKERRKDAKTIYPD